MGVMSAKQRDPAQARPTPKTTPGGHAVDAVDAGPARVPDTDASAPACGGFASLSDEVGFTILSEGLAVTYWFAPTLRPETYPVTIRFTGNRLGVTGRLQPNDQFTHDETIEHVVPGSGPLALTAKIGDLAPGKWVVTARAVEPGAQGLGRQTRANRKLRKEREQAVATPVSASSQLPPLLRLWYHWGPAAGAPEHIAKPTHTHLLPFARTPGILPGVWGVMVGLGVVAALITQSLALSHDHRTLGSLWVVWLATLAVGALGAKLWFIVTYRHERHWAGWCIQGFITGATGAAALTLVALHIAVGVFLDAVAPGVLFGMAIGRLGCFFAGCCGGPPTAAWWGVWSSDQHVCARRVPTQLLESALAARRGRVTLIVVLGHGPADGAIFVAGVAAYTLGRQGVLWLRAEPLKTRLGLPITAALAALVFVASVVDSAFLAR